MIFSTAAVRRLSSSLLVVAMAATTPSGVGGATTMNRKLSKNSSPAPPPPTTTKCPSATLYYHVIIENTLGSRHIVQVFPGMPPLGEGQAKICDPDGVFCIGDTFTFFNTLYADPGLTQQVATLASTAKVINIKADGARMYMSTGAIVYEDTKTELNYGGYFMDEEFENHHNGDTHQHGHDMAISGGTRECTLAFGTVDFRIEPEVDYGSIEFHLVDMAQAGLQISHDYVARYVTPEGLTYYP